MFVGKKHFVLIFLFFNSFISLLAQQLEVGIMRGFSSSTVEFSQFSNSYEVYSDSILICSLNKEDKLILKREADKIRVKKNENSMGLFGSVFLKETKPNSYLSLQCKLPAEKKLRKYQNNFNIQTEGTNYLKIINEVELDNYLSGVIESEGGGGKKIEYYKVQAILSRTYVLDHLKKHYKDGFQVCDEVHCQAYYSMERFTPDIKKAVSETKHIVMIGPDFKLADGFFFANCGGQTSESDFVWNVPIQHCKSVKDTFCIHSKQANWEKKIYKHEWKKYLKDQFGIPVEDSLFSELIFRFDQPSRTAFFLSPHLGIPLRDLRENFKLKSTWFSCKPQDEFVVLNGKGFGHGVGLCQEGAMKMAVLGYNYKQILHFYFTGIELFDYQVWSFLRQSYSQDGAVGL